MSKTYAHYTESTKRNVVAAVRSGLSIRGMGKRLSTPESTISQWVHSPRYSDVAPASEEVLAAIPSLPCPENDSQSGFVKVRKGWTLDDFMYFIDRYLNWFRNEKIKTSLNNKSPKEYRTELSLAL